MLRVRAAQTLRQTPALQALWRPNGCGMMDAERPAGLAGCANACEELACGPRGTPPTCGPASVRWHTSDKAATSKKCWDCKVPVDDRSPHFCGQCKKIQPPGPTTDQFEVLGIKPSFEVDEAALEARYKTLQKALHPDKFSQASPQEREFSEEQASAVNAAYQTLRHPLRRARALLRLHGLEPSESARVEDPELLGYVMDAREEVENTRTPEGLNALLDENRQRERVVVKALTGACRTQNWRLAADLTNRLRYINRIQEAIIEKM